MNSIITTRGTWVEFEKVRGQKAIPQTVYGHKNEKRKMFSFFILGVVLQGSEP